MDAIVSVTTDWGIGKEGKLLVPNPADMRRFRELTTGGTVICGRTTFDSFPRGALPERLNIVVTRDRNLGELSPDVVVTHNPQEAVQEAMLSHYGNGRIWVIGGASIYRQLLPLCDNAYVTMHETVVNGADAFFPNLEGMLPWHLEDEQGAGVTADGIRFKFLRYGRRLGEAGEEILANR